LLTQTVSLQSTAGAGAITDADAAAALKDGEAAAATGEWRVAAQSFIRASENDSTKKNALFDLGVAYNHLGIYARALDCEQQVTQIDEKYVPAYVQMGTILTKMGDLGGAEVAFSKVLTLEPGNAEAKTSLAAVRQRLQTATQPKKDDSVQAVKIFDGSEAQAVSASAEKEEKPIEIVMPGQAVNKYIKDETIVEAQQTNQSGAAPAKAAGNDAAPSATAGSDASETSAALMSAADLLKGNPGKSTAPLPALAAPDAAKEAAAEQAAKLAAKERKALDYIMEATVYFNSGSVDSARKSLLFALQVEERCSIAHANLGVILGTQGDYEGEVREERRACELDPKNAEAHLNLAWALAKTNRYAESASEYDRALELAEAAKADDKGALLAATLPEARSGKAYMLAKLGKKREAIALLTEARTQNGDKAWPCTTLGAVFIDEKRFEDASQALKEALVREPDNYEAIKYLAQLNFQTNKLPDAISNYQKLINIKPYDLDAYLGIAAAQEKLGQKEGALKALQSAANVAPDNTAVQTSLRNLEHKHGSKKEAQSSQRLSQAK
jgi:tetratricopeptide (TPR) repeat protein